MKYYKISSHNSLKWIKGLVSKETVAGSETRKFGFIDIVD